MEWVLLAIVCVLAGAVAGWFAGRAKQTAQLAALSARLEAAGENETRLEQSLRAVSMEAAAHSRQAVGDVLAPLHDSLHRYEQHLGDVERARRDAYAQLRVQLGNVADVNESLRNSTSQLLQALRTPQVRGRWGEVQLRRIVEIAGMVDHCDFSEQVSADVDGSVVRPDLVVRLSGDRQLVVDAKVPLNAYLGAMEADDEADREAHLVLHAKHVRSHVEALSKKNYWRAMADSPEFTVLFVPADTFLDAALKHDASLLEDAFGKGIILASPATLMALLRTVAHTWQQQALTENARLVHQLGRELHARLQTVAGHFVKLGSSLEAATGAYNAAVASVESRLLVTARRFHDLGVATEVPQQVSQVLTTTRKPSWGGESDES
ncbi:DNA recombination protein RmuC [Natronoglycomyces albus]|uniref:DNA recombination protein RmuC n=1 Tax=Natronoglycomyces albus TaxID=2811108 RepID=A0A895XM69_9ACTN|nr:DNA recombination protein RmuC [Natronoglycomyces albus]QSB04633.1 DNA recombination protein RmuC [Natronoglycomyces albus]